MKKIMPIIFMLAAIALFFFYTNVQFKTLKLNTADYNKITEANDKATKLRAVRQFLTDDRNKIAQEDINKIVKMIPDGVENVGLIIDIDNIASKYGMRIRNTKVNDSSSRKNSNSAVTGPDSKKYGTIALSFSVSTTYENFLVFLKDLEASQRIVDVTALTFSSNKEGRYEFNITLQTYWLK